MKRINKLLKLFLVALLVALLLQTPATAGIRSFVKSVANATGDMVDDVVDGAKGTYNDAKRGAKRIYKTGKNLGEYFVEAEKRGLTRIVNVGTKVIKTEAQLLEHLATSPLYAVTDFVRSRMPVKRPDLTISHLTLSDDGYVMVYVQNIGEGIITIDPRNRVDTMDLYLKVDDKNWGGSTHKHFDPEHVLLYPGGRLSVETDLKLTSPKTITAIIDMNHAVIESNENNNASTKKLDPRKPDLVIEKLSLDQNCMVNVVVKNVGQGPVNEMVWLHKKYKDTGLYLKVDGKNWGGVTFRGLDKHKKLSHPNGVVIYQSNLKVQAQATITATIDNKSQIDEADETNNQVTQTLKCAPFTNLRPAGGIAQATIATPGNSTQDSQRRVIIPHNPQAEIKPIKPADLQVVRIGVTQDLTAGNDTVFVAHIYNAGVARAPASKAMIRVGGETHGKIFNIPALDGGNSYTIRRTEKLNIGPSYRTMVIVDIDKQVREGDEHNNEAILNFSVPNTH